MQLYGPLLRTAWTIAWDWATSYSLLSTTVLAAISMVVSVAVVEFAFTRPELMIRRIARLFLELVVGPLAIVGGMFMISLIYYAPTIFLTQTSEAVAHSAKQEQQATDSKQCQAQVSNFNGQVATLQKQITQKEADLDTLQKSFLKQVKRVKPNASTIQGLGRYVQLPIPSTNPENPYGVKVIVQFEKVIALPATFIVHCNGPIGKGEASLSATGMINQNQGPGIKGHEDIYGIKVFAATLAGSSVNNALDPETQVIFRLFANHPITAVGVEID